MHSTERKTPRPGFTLLEVVLGAWRLSVVVFSLLSMAIEMYLMRVDQSRGRVEANQLAPDGGRPDRHGPPGPPRYSAPVQSSSASAGGSSGSGSSSSSGGASSIFGSAGGSISSSEQLRNQQFKLVFPAAPVPLPAVQALRPADTSTDAEAGVIRGIFGTSDRLRIDRAEPLDLTRRFVNQEELLSPRPVDLPQSVIYFLREGRRMTAADFAARGGGRRAAGGRRGPLRLSDAHRGPYRNGRRGGRKQPPSRMPCCWPRRWSS